MKNCLEKWCGTRCSDVETEITRDKIEFFELTTPDIVLTPQWRIRKQLWLMVFAVSEFIEEYKKEHATNPAALDVILHNKIYQIVELCKNNDEPLYEAFYPFIAVIAILVQLVPLFLKEGHPIKEETLD